MRNPDAAHFARVEKYASNVYQLYLKTLRDIARLLHSLPIDNTKPFNFNDYPQIKQRVDLYILELTKKIKTQIDNGISAEWLHANIKNDELMDDILKGSRLTEAQRKVYYSRNQAGLKAFLQRKEDGLNLSDRVWLYTNQYKNEMEMAVDVAISEKVSAQELSQTVRQYLQQPNTLFRRVRDKNGVLHLSKRAANYHPGRGVYRSSYKNAMRLAGTEINMAYRTADHERIKDLPFVKGFKVVTSNNHPVRDICDDLKGDYPKEFIFKGWHVKCRCHCITLMVSDSEYNDIERKLLAGEDISTYQSPTSVKDVPKGFDTWIAENKHRVKGWSSLPYFMKDNPGFVNGLKLPNFGEKISLMDVEKPFDFNIKPISELRQKRITEIEDSFLGIENQIKHDLKLLNESVPLDFKPYIKNFNKLDVIPESIDRDGNLFVYHNKTWVPAKNKFEVEYRLYKSEGESKSIIKSRIDKYENKLSTAKSELSQIKNGALDNQILEQEQKRLLTERQDAILLKYGSDDKLLKNISDSLKKEFGGERFTAKSKTSKYLQTDNYKIRTSNHNSRTEQDAWGGTENRNRPVEYDTEDINIIIEKDRGGALILNINKSSYDIAEFNIKSKQDLIDFILAKVKKEIQVLGKK